LKSAGEGGKAMDILNFITSMGPVPAVCFILGFILLVIEMFHPGFGVPGVTGLILLLIGVILSARTVLEALIMIIVILALLGIALSFVLNSATKGFLSKKLVLSQTSKKESGYIGTEDLSYFLGKEGVATSILRPAGTANFDGVRLDVVSEGEFIAKDMKIVVVKVEGRRIVVRENQ
jgi:membrane-bound ClpP family serine protease